MLFHCIALTRSVGISGLKWPAWLLAHSLLVVTLGYTDGENGLPVSSGITSKENPVSSILPWKLVMSVQVHTAEVQMQSLS